jgi:DNA-binding HxlR family transcriptional regulator
MTRMYGDYCGLAHALDLVGGRWSLLVIRDLLNGPKRFKELEAGLAGIPTNVLSARLRELEESGVLGRRLQPPPGRGVVYELTDYGHELEEALMALGLWGAKSLPTPGPGIAPTIGALALALRGAFRPEAAGDLNRTYDLRLDDESLLVTVQNRQTRISSGPGSSDLVLTTTPETLMALLRRGVSIDDALANGQIVLTGRKPDARRFFDLFRLSD